MLSRLTAPDSIRLACAALTAVLLACTSPAGTPAPSAINAIGAFGPEAVQQAVTTLASAGIPVRIRPNDAPISSVSAPSRVQLLRFQARNLALEASAAGGTPGSELDAYARAAGTQPLAALIAGWARTADSPASRAALSLAPGLAQSDLAGVTLPGIVAMLFLGDIAGPATASLGQQAVAAMGGPVAQGDFCGQVSAYLSASLAGVMDPELNLEPAWLADAIRLYSTIDPNEDSLRKAVGALALLAYATSISRPWVVSLSALPNAVHHVVSGNELAEPAKSLALVVVPGPESVAEEVGECAALAEVELAEAEIGGTPVLWYLDGLQQHAVDVEGDLELEERGQTASAGLEYETIEETLEAHREGTLRTALAIVTAAVVRTEIDDVERTVADILTGGGLGASGAAVAAEYARLQPVLKDLLLPRGSAQVEITWHEGPEPTPEPSADPTPDESPDDEPEPRVPCQSGCGSSNGDPHIVTLDGTGYDFQSAGEFTLLRPQDGSFEIQVRQEPYEGSQSVSINTAVALGVSGRRVAIYMNPDDSSFDVLVDGADADTTETIDLGAASVSPKDLGLEVVLDEGTTMYLSTDGGFGINLVVDPSAALAASGVGVMGLVPDGSIGVPALPDGTAIPPADSDDAYYDAVYVRFADAWRVTDATSLFDYADGTTAASYVIAGYPVRGSAMTLDDLTPEQRAVGEAACRGVPVEFLRDQCIFDVAVTGDSGFAAAYDLTANLVERGSLKPSAQPTRVVNLYADDAGPVPLDVYSWSTEQDAAFITEAPYATATSFFDPAVIDGPFGPSTRLSMQRHGLALAEWAFNQVDDNERTITPGLVRTFVVVSGDPGAFTITGQREARFSVLYDVDPAGFGVPDAPEGQGLVWVDTSGIEYTHPEVTFYVGADGRCLTDPDFPTLAQITGTYRGGVTIAVPVGAKELTLHAVKDGADPFAGTCDGPPIHGPIPIDVTAGGRFYLFVYATPGANRLQTLVVPIEN